MDDAARCTAHSTRTGERCGKAKAHGTDVCATHGAAAPQVKAAGKRRQDEARASRAVATYGLPVEVDPHQALLDEVHRCAGHVSWLGEIVSELENKALTHGITRTVQKADGSRDVTAEAAVNVWVKLYQDERDRLVRVAKACIDAGIDERRVRLAEEQGQVIVQVLKATLADLGVDVTPEVAETVGRHLRAVS